jgi:hypothetical protein
MEPYGFPKDVVQMTFARRVFLLAGIYGLLALTPMYFLEGRLGRDFPPPVAHPEHFYGFVGVALAWQLAFLVIARDPRRYRPMMVPSILEKLSFGGAVWVLFLQDRVSPIMLGPASIDLVLAALFGVAFWRSREGRGDAART